MSNKPTYNRFSIGFTGSRNQPTPEATAWLTQKLYSMTNSTNFPPRFHHGDCVGADAVAHEIAYKFCMPIVIHPPIESKYQAWCFGTMETGVLRLTPKPYLDRNHDIVDECGILIALPSGPESLRSGTWSTVRYAKRLDRQIFIGPYEGK